MILKKPVKIHSSASSLFLSAHYDATIDPTLPMLTFDCPVLFLFFSTALPPSKAELFTFADSLDLRTSGWTNDGITLPGMLDLEGDCASVA